jgi:hypothetical protein
MATEAQIAANRRNASKSTGPRTRAGKDAASMNALKTGIHAKAQVIPGESAAGLAQLAGEYHFRFHPATPEQRFLVDTLVNSEWLLRRLRQVEAQLWVNEMQDAYSLKDDCPLGQVFSGSGRDFTLLQRRIDSAERSYHRALEKLERGPSAPSAAPLPPGSGAQPEPVPIPAPSTPRPKPIRISAPELASFRSPECGASPSEESPGRAPSAVAYNRAEESEARIYA